MGWYFLKGQLLRNWVLKSSQTHRVASGQFSEGKELMLNHRPAGDRISDSHLNPRLALCQNSTLQKSTGSLTWSKNNVIAKETESQTLT